MNTIVENREPRVPHRSRITQEITDAATRGEDATVRKLLRELLCCSNMHPRHKLGAQLRALEDLFNAFSAMAMSDDLTGLHNRRGFFRQGNRLLEYAHGQGRGVIAVIVDLDNLKVVNDTVGHAAGDDLLRRTAEVLRQVFPRFDVLDVIGRLGGDEFAVLTIRDDVDSAEDVAARIRRAGDRQAAAKDDWPLRMSVGAAASQPGSHEEIHTLLDRAEKLMYLDKFRRRAKPVADRPGALRSNAAQM